MSLAPGSRYFWFGVALALSRGHLQILLNELKSEADHLLKQN